MDGILCIGLFKSAIFPAIGDLRENEKEIDEGSMLEVLGVRKTVGTPGPNAAWRQLRYYSKSVRGLTFYLQTSV